jgi:hypothetical protein
VRIGESTKAWKAVIPYLNIREGGDEAEILDYPDRIKVSGTVSFSAPGRLGLKRVQVVKVGQ